MFSAKIKARDQLLVRTAVKAATLHPSSLPGPPLGGMRWGSVTSGCFEDPAAAVHHGARHSESVKPQFVAGEHRFNPHSGRLLPQPVQGIRTWEKEGGERRKPEVRAHLPSYPSNTRNCCWSSAALLCGLP